jgi:hypothetical protein
MGYSITMKTFKIIGRYWSPKHGYLVTRSEHEIEARNKTSAMNLLKQGFRDGSISREGCNQWHHYEGPASAEESQDERDYWAQDPLGEGDPEIMPNGRSRY